MSILHCIIAAICVETPLMDKKDKMKYMDRIFFPRSIAIIGASEVPGKWGFLLTSNILGGGYEGDVFPVNPKKDKVMGLKAYPSIKDIPGEVDLAIIAIPARLVPDAFKECVAKGIHAAVVITSGFRETGEEGARLQSVITDIAEQGDMVFVGPNTMGTVSTFHNLISMGVPLSPMPGGLAVISQSGNIGNQMIDWATHKGFNVGFYAGTGNEAMLKTSDLLEYFGSKEEVKALALYIEGLDNGRDFMDAARRITRTKPVIALKAGATSSGSKAAKSHTGSMAGSFEVFSAMFKQAGIVQVGTPSELVNVAGAMSNIPVPRGNRIGIMTLGGGWGVVTADECEKSGLYLPPLSEEIIGDLDKRLPGYWNRTNPIDTVGETDIELQVHILNVLAHWDAVDSIIALGMVGREVYLANSIKYHERVSGKKMDPDVVDALMRKYHNVEMRFFTEAARLQSETSKPIIAVSLSGGSTETIVRIKEHGNILFLSTPEQAVNIIKHMYVYRKYLDGYGIRVSR